MNSSFVHFFMAFLMAGLSYGGLFASEGDRALPSAAKGEVTCHEHLNNSHQYLMKIGERNREFSPERDSSLQYLQEIDEGVHLLEAQSTDPGKNIAFINASSRLKIFTETGIFTRILIQYFREIKELTSYQDIYNSWELMKSTVAFGGEDGLAMAHAEISRMLSLLPGNLPEFSFANAQVIESRMKEFNLTNDQYAALASLVNNQSDESLELLHIGFTNEFFHASDRLMKEVASRASGQPASSFLQRFERRRISVPLSNQKRSLDWKQHIDQLVGKKRKKLTLGFLFELVESKSLNAAELSDIILYYLPYRTRLSVDRSLLMELQDKKQWKEVSAIKEVFLANSFTYAKWPRVNHDLYIMLVGLQKTTSVPQGFPLEKFKLEFLNNLQNTQFRQLDDRAQVRALRLIDENFQRLKELQLKR